MEYLAEGYMGKRFLAGAKKNNYFCNLGYLNLWVLSYALLFFLSIGIKELKLSFNGADLQFPKIISGFFFLSDYLLAHGSLFLFVLFFGAFIIITIYLNKSNFGGMVFRYISFFYVFFCYAVLILLLVLNKGFVDLFVMMELNK